MRACFSQSGRHQVSWTTRTTLVAVLSKWIAAEVGLVTPMFYRTARDTVRGFVQLFKKEATEGPNDISSQSVLRPFGATHTPICVVVSCLYNMSKHVLSPAWQATKYANLDQPRALMLWIHRSTCRHSAHFENDAVG